MKEPFILLFKALEYLTYGPSPCPQAHASLRSFHATSWCFYANQKTTIHPNIHICQHCSRGMGTESRFKILPCSHPEISLGVFKRLNNQPPMFGSKFLQRPHHVSQRVFIHIPMNDIVHKLHLKNSYSKNNSYSSSFVLPDRMPNLRLTRIPCSIAKS